MQFYKDDDEFLDSLSEFVGAALGSGARCLVIATGWHRKGLAERLTAHGLDMEYAARTHRYRSLDAEETLKKFMVDGWPNEELFVGTIEPELPRADEANARSGAPLVGFGEMVALLSAQGKTDAAIRLEQLWNSLASKHAFSLRCAYPMGCFGSDAQNDLFRRVCEEHAEVVPTESYTSLPDEDTRLRMVSGLEQKAASLAAAMEGCEREIAQRHDVEQKLRRTEEFARKVVENSIDCVKVLDLEGKLEYMSQPGRKAMEIGDLEPVMGRRWVDFWRDADKARAQAAVDKARKGGVGSFQGEFLTVSGALKSWDVKISPALGDDGEVERLIAISRDITELRSAQQALLQTEKLAAAGRLAATVAHEINNPLEAVTNFIYLAMISKDVPPEVSRYLEIADRELARVAQIAQQTLGFYKDNSRLRWVDAAELINGVMTIYERKARNKQLQIAISVDTSMKVWAKQGELKQALSNLVANAIDASSPGGKLWLHAHPSKNWTNGREDGLRITLADNGSGMSAEVQRKIFKPFFTTKQDVGTGIGLWVTKALIEQSGGYLRFRSRQGERPGTVMSFFIPRAAHEQADDLKLTA